jgi:hypothetical protein
VARDILPGVGSFNGATILQGETYTAAGAFADADPGSWTATVNYGDGSGVQALALSAKRLTLNHRYTAAGSVTVIVTVTDNQNGSGTGTALVTVQMPQQGITVLLGSVNATSLSADNKTALNAPLNAAVSALNSGNRIAATQQMEAFVNQVDALVKSQQLSVAEGQTLTADANRMIVSINL